MNKHILIIGSGSAGKRHARNLKSLGCDISCFDPRKDRTNELATEIDIVNQFQSLDEAINSGNYHGAVVSSPTAFHVKQCVKVLDSINRILLEKPVSINLNEAIQLAKLENRPGTRILLGYTWRWWEPLRKVKNLIDNGRIGNVIHVQFHMSAHLADWHPWESYKDFFMSSKEQGGGALLDESHWIDLMIWFFGMPNELLGTVEKISSLEIDSDDNVDVLLKFNTGLRVSLHLDLFGRPHEKFIRFIGENGTILWTADPNRILISDKMEQEWFEETFSYQRNDMFINVAIEFIDLIENSDNVANCTLIDGIRTMKVIEAIRLSSSNGVVVQIQD